MVKLPTELAEERLVFVLSGWCSAISGEGWVELAGKVRATNRLMGGGVIRPMSM